MAKTSAPNSAGSQYFITEVPYPSLNWNYAAFGKIYEGFEVIQAISDVPTDANDKPLVDVVIDSIRIMTASFYAVTPEEDSLFATAGDPMAFGLLTNDLEVTYSWFLDNELQPETEFIYSPILTVNGSHEIMGIGSKNGYDYYRIWWVEITGGTNTPNDLLVNKVILYQNSPNPFNPETTISFALSTPESVKLDIFNMKGQHIRTLAYAEYDAGMHSINWNGTDDYSKTVSSGIYFYRLQAGSHTEIKRALLLK